MAQALHRFDMRLRLGSIRDTTTSQKKAAAEVSDFRPISLTNNISKILEQVILINLQMEEDPIPEYQFGFRRGHSTLDALCLLRDRIEKGFRQCVDGGATPQAEKF